MTWHIWQQPFAPAGEIPVNEVEISSLESHGKTLDLDVWAFLRIRGAGYW